MELYDKNFNKFFYNWLFFTFCLVFLMIILGGLTRLTNSGLSITEWELFKGILPPITSEGWNNYFSLYKNIPQYQLINNNMTLNEFKIIYYAKKPTKGEKAKNKLKLKKYNPNTRKHEFFVEKKLPPHSK